MRNCPYCAEEIQDAARFCKHCGRYVAQDEAISPEPAAPVAPTAVTPAPPTYPPAAPAYQPAAPAYPPEAPAYQPVAPAYQPVQPMTPLATVSNPVMAQLMQQYMQKGYKVVPSALGGANLERPDRDFSVSLFVILLFLFGIGALVYLFIYFVFMKRKVLRVQLLASPEGSVQEIGDTLAVMARVSQDKQRKLAFGFGIFFAILAGLMLLFDLIYIPSGISAGAPGGEIASTFAIIFFCLFTPLAAAAGLLFWRSKVIKKKMNPENAYQPPDVYQPPTM